MIRVTRIGCGKAGRIIDRFSQSTTGSHLGIFVPVVDGWRCYFLRPYSDGHGHEQWQNQCIRSGGGRINWYEVTLRSRVLN